MYLANRVFADLVSELGEFARDPSTAPQGILASHLHDERDDLWRDRRSTDAPGLPGPETGESPAVPREDGFRFHDRKRMGPSRPDLRDDAPEGAIDRAKLWPGPGTLEHGELLAQDKDLHDQARAGPQRGNESAKQSRQDRKHR